MPFGADARAHTHQRAQRWALDGSTIADQGLGPNKRGGPEAAYRIRAKTGDPHTDRHRDTLAGPGHVDSGPAPLIKCVVAQTNAGS